MKHILLNVVKSPVTAKKIFSKNLTILSSEKSFHEGGSKIKVVQMFDMLKWAIKYWEECDYYYHYKLDSYNSTFNGYLSKKKFMELREKSNRCFSGGRKIDYTSILTDKIIFSQLAKDNFNNPETYFYIRNNKINDAYRLNTKNLIEYFPKNTKVIIKDSLGQEAGKINIEADGVLLVEEIDGEFLLNNKSTSVERICNILMKKPDWIAQEFLIQEDSIKRLNSSSVNTIRLLTINNGNEIEICKAVLKVGSPGEIVDNFWTGGILINIDVDTGKFDGGYLFEHQSRDVATTQQLVSSLKGNDVPNWADVITQAKSAHEMVPRIKSIGWDVAITKDKAVIIEGNDNWDIVMFQAFEPLKYYLTDKLTA
ncbi:sugar-transfer associated ATP-grasp domain-containing protein [Vibrio breoganii]